MRDRLRLLELFAGTGSVGRVARERGWQVFSTDSDPAFGCDITEDIMLLDLVRLPFLPDVVWASPPCTWFTVASISTHWTPDHRPKTELARYGVELVARTRRIIVDLTPKLWYIENPVGKLRKLPVVADVPRRVNVTYCQYGDTRMKPTDIFTNDLLWVPRPPCRAGDPCHVSAPRGSKAPGTTQGMSPVDRGRIPELLCNEILESAEAQLREGVPA